LNRQDEAYAAQLTRKGVTPAKLTDLAQKLTAWKQLDQAQNVAMVACTQATANRDAAAKALNEWLAEYKQFARTQFKDQPAIAKRLLL
jgi:sulfur relay (sulfurtransferase) complex TusBCD TusD component (DsrE family)